MDIRKQIKQIDSDNKIELYNLYNILIKDNDKLYLDYLFYSLKKYEHIENNIETIEDKIKRKDNNFKNKVKEYYKTCIITGRSNIVCEVAHIFPFSDSDLNDKYNEFNGILLCRDLHCLFDKKLININPTNFELILNDEILEDKSLEVYHQYNKKILNIRQESRYYLNKLYNNK